MLKKFVIVVFTTFALTLNVSASSDGDLILKKNDPSEVKDCFEGLNRATFAFNQALDGIIFKPVAKVYIVSDKENADKLYYNLKNNNTNINLENISVFNP